MKRRVLLLPLLACAAALTGCVEAPPQPFIGAPVYPGYYGQGYYNEPPPGPSYAPIYRRDPYVYGPGPYGGGVAVIRSERFRNRFYRNHGYYPDERRFYGNRGYYRGGRRYARSTDRDRYRSENSAAFRRPARGHSTTHAHASRSHKQAKPTTSHVSAPQPAPGEQPQLPQ